jgi:L-malate glycosyltransferase
MIRILYLVQGLGVGGAEKQLLYLLQALDRSRFAPTLAAFRASGELRPAFEAADVPVVDLNIEFPIARPRNLRSVHHFLQWMRAERFDILHSWLFHANVLAAFLGPRAGIGRVVLAERDVGYFHGNLHRLAARLAFRRAARIVPNTQAVADALVSRHLARKEQLMLIPNGVRFPAAAPTAEEVRLARRRFGLPEDGLVVATVGRFAPVKGHAHFIEAAAIVQQSFPHAVFALAGDGECAAQLRERARALQIDSVVKFVGVVDDVPAFLSGVDVFVMPSLSEGLANALMEAMALARPIVATRVGGNSALIENGRSGLLVPAADARALAEAINAQLRERERACMMGQSARMAIQPYSIEKMVARTVELYEQLLASR